MRILVVEDEEKVANFIRMGLRQEQYAVDIAKDGREGLHLAESVDYDLMILDLMLPGIPGLELLKRLREHKKMIPVLILTAKGDVDDKVAGLDSGANDYLVKQRKQPIFSAARIWSSILPPKPSDAADGKSS
jgi:DNA-binding response OmpR family regulator